MHFFHLKKDRSDVASFLSLLPSGSFLPLYLPFFWCVPNCTIRTLVIGYCDYFGTNHKDIIVFRQ